jgi:hypothetical protein
MERAQKAMIVMPRIDTPKRFFSGFVCHLSFIAHTPLTSGPSNYSLDRFGLMRTSRPYTLPVMQKHSGCGRTTQLAKYS